jgi:hypothetical protein
MEQDIFPEQQSDQPVSVLSFSKTLGCSHTAVQNAIRDGKIVRGVVRREGKPDKILPSMALEEWKRNVSMKQVEQNPTLVQNITGGNRAKKTESEQGEVKRIAEYEAREKYAKARTAELNLEVLEGSLVRREDVNRAQTAVGIEIRTMLESLGDRNIDNILAAGSRNASLLVLETAVHEILQRISDLGYTEEVAAEI